MNLFIKDQDHQIKINSAKGSKLLKVMSNQNRLFILFCLNVREHTVGELEAMLNLSQSALSQHLAILRKDGFVRTRRSAQHIYYYLKDSQVSQVLATLSNLYSKSVPTCAFKNAPLKARGSEARPALF
jgi:DNA-binding transcriptional ArsR family regulator